MVDKKVVPTKCSPQIKESGEKWDEPLTKAEHCKLHINFYNNLVGYTAGDCVSGTIDIVLEHYIAVEDLILEFVGLERCFLVSPLATTPL